MPTDEDRTVKTFCDIPMFSVLKEYSTKHTTSASRESYPLPRVLMNHPVHLLSLFSNSA